MDPDKEVKFFKRFLPTGICHSMSQKYEWHCGIVHCFVFCFNVTRPKTKMIGMFRARVE